MFNSHFRPCAGLLVLLIAATGCSRGSGTVPVSGVIKLDDRPLANASVTFIPQNSEGGREAFGFTNAEGVFHLATNKVADGALPGKYKVVVRPVPPADAGAAHKSQREAMKQVSTGTPPRPSVTLPPQYSDATKTILTQDVPPSGKVVFELRSN